MPKALGGLLARALPQARHAVYAGMYMHDCNTKSCEKDAFNFTEDHLDDIVNKIGHIGFGPAESLTTLQHMSMYDVDVLGCQQLNPPDLPRMRSRASGYLKWTSPFPRFMVAKARSSDHILRPRPRWDKLAMICVFVKGTNDFQDAAKLSSPKVTQEHEDGSAKVLEEKTAVGITPFVLADGHPSMVADTLVELDAKTLAKPYRLFAEPGQDSSVICAALVDNSGANLNRRLGLE
ncbi:hypothetical protein M433DRAFT_132940 [Acidomyces richmondensis BFW]|nr:MAG: hypothetical protein FE78DRAFT_68326 [Acidomyces sp. 'richmondensis']KYG47458.1 hypothetical protein M433DRAFT_132940 [Acidomyces richmondensis BFW]